LSCNVHNWDYLNFNCYTGKASTGSPVLRDWRFRHALNYAVDRQELCRVAFGGQAEPATSLVTPNSWTNADYHWQPPASEVYTFDLARANQLLDQAGYARGPNGTRLYKGKPITLRLIARSKAPESQTEGKLITGCFQQLGLKINLSVITTAALQSRLYAFKGSTYAPDFDMYVWDWDGWNGPGQELAAEITAQIGATNEPCWFNAEYDKLNHLQATTLDPQQRKVYIWRMQQIMYEQTPWMVLTYPHHFEAYNTGKWTGWTRVSSGLGPVIYQAGNIDTYLNLRLRGSGERKSGGSSVVTIVVVGAPGAIVIIGGVMVWRLRRSRRAVEV
jgi:peptide/nickel transport system substrate-binding protein